MNWPTDALSHNRGTDVQLSGRIKAFVAISKESSARVSVTGAVSTSWADRVNQFHRVKTSRLKSARDERRSVCLQRELSKGHSGSRSRRPSGDSGDLGTLAGSLSAGGNHGHKTPQARRVC